MGAGSSVKVIKSIEVSFLDKNTEKLLPENEIINISNQACIEFDYKPTYYDAYKIDKYGNNPYKEYSKILGKSLIK
jgi:hypothetical protein